MLQFNDLKWRIVGNAIAAIDQGIIGSTQDGVANLPMEGDWSSI